MIVLQGMSVNRALSARSTARMISSYSGAAQSSSMSLYQSSAQGPSKLGSVRLQLRSSTTLRALTANPALAAEGGAVVNVQPLLSIHNSIDNGSLDGRQLIQHSPKLFYMWRIKHLKIIRRGSGSTILLADNSPTALQAVRTNPALAAYS